jgi:hypothetical protein
VTDALDDFDFEDEDEEDEASEDRGESVAEMMARIYTEAGKAHLLEGDSQLAAAQTRAKELEAALQSAATDPEREQIAKEHTATAALIDDLKTALPFEDRDDDALTEAFEDAEVAYEEAQERFAEFKAKESDPSLPRSARYRRARRKELDALAAKDAVKKEQRRRQDKAGYIKAREQLLASMTAGKVADQKAKNLSELQEELRGRVPIGEANFLLEQRRRELNSNTPPEFTKKAREEAEAEYQLGLDGTALVTDQHWGKQ